MQTKPNLLDNIRTDRAKAQTLQQRVNHLKSLQAQLTRNSTPYKAATKRASSAYPLPRLDLRELSRHAGSSRSKILDMIKAISATETGCRTATTDELHRLQFSSKNANTTQGSYNG